MSLIPVLLPIVLTGLDAALHGSGGWWEWTVHAIGDKDMALTLGALGCGSKPFPWMNDVGFWIITRLSGLREAQTLRTVSPMMSIQGAAGLVLTILAAWLFPMRE